MAVSYGSGFSGGSVSGNVNEVALGIARNLSRDAAVAVRNAEASLEETMRLKPSNTPPAINVGLGSAAGDGGASLPAFPSGAVGADAPLLGLVEELAGTMQGLLDTLQTTAANNAQLTIPVLSPLPRTNVAPGTFTDTVSLPSAPSTYIPPAPTLTAPVLPTFPTMSYPFPDTTSLDAIEAALPTFAYNEGSYTPKLDSELETRIKAVFRDGMGLPQSYFDTIWARASTDLQRQQNTQLRALRNGGASSWWGLPAEAVLATTKEVIDETTKAAQKARIESAVQQAVMMREDFWKAMDAGTKVEQMWISLHDSVANRALDAAKYAINAAVQEYNLLVSRINADLAIIQARTSLHQTQLDVEVKKVGAALDIMRMRIEEDKNTIARSQGQWQIYKTQTEAEVGVFAEKVKLWTAKSNNYAQIEQLVQGSYDVAAKRVSTLIQNIAGMASAAGAVGTGMSAAASAANTTGQLQLEGYKAQASTILDTNRLFLDANKIRAELQARYTEWANNQAIELAKLAAELRWTYATAAIQASDVSIGSTVSSNFSESASRNLEKIW
jgi:hypothetical protein